MATPIDPPPLPARLAERYDLQERLADGGSAEVWLARDPVLDRAVAIKVLHRHLLSDSTMRARLDQEARAAAALAHPGIVTVHDVEIDDTAAAVVLEFVDGESLSDRIARDGPLAPTEAARIGAELAEALAHAHERGVVHRDVKPANVLIDAEGRARLVDFGIARVMEDAESRLTSTGMIAGTLRYLAPEQLRGEMAGPAADVYGVGAVIAEMLTGRPPYDASSPLELAQAQRLPPPRLEGVPAELADIVERCLDPDPGRRPTAVMLAVELRNWLAAVAATDADAATAMYPAVAAVTGPAAAGPAIDPAATTEFVPAPVPVGAPVAETAPTPPPVATRPSESAPSNRRAIWPLVAAILAIPLVLIVGASLLGSGASSPSASAGAGAAASLAGEPTPKPAKTNAPPAAQPATLDAAVAAFDQLLADGEKNGSIDRRSADDLRKRADDIAKKPNGPKKNDTSKQIDDLRKKVDDLERMKKIDSAAFADDLRAAIDDIDAAANG